MNFKYCRFQKEIVLRCVRWYLAYPLSLRRVEEMMTERGVSVDHSTINRWVNKFSPLLEAEARRRQMLGLGRWVVSEKWLCASYLQPQLFETAQAILRKNAKFNPAQLVNVCPDTSWGHQLSRLFEARTLVF